MEQSERQSRVTLLQCDCLWEKESGPVTRRHAVKGKLYGRRRERRTKKNESEDEVSSLVKKADASTFVV